MSTDSAELLPASEPFRRALEWLSSHRMEEPKRPLSELITEAGRQFDLSPKEELSLRHLLLADGG